MLFDSEFKNCGIGKESHDGRAVFNPVRMFIPFAPRSIFEVMPSEISGIFFDDVHFIANALFINEDCLTGFDAHGISKMDAR
jgi:hypothetical protein